MFKKKRNKIFCVGFNKTGTTSLENTLIQHGFQMGDQRNGELLFDDWVKRDFRSVIKLAESAEAFQDVPFSLPYTFIALDQYFHNAKFILTIRNSSEEWYESLLRFHTKLWRTDETRAINAEDLKMANYIYKGWPFYTNQHIFNTSEEDVYNKHKLISIYENHNKSVIDYFRYKPGKLLLINVSEEGSYNKLCHFIGHDPVLTSFPKLNSSK